MIPIKIGSIKAELPSSWDEVTLSQYIEMARHAEDLSIIRLLSIMSGVDYFLIINVNQESFDDRIIDHLTFINQPIDVHSLPCPGSLTIDGKILQIPSDPGKCTIGQKLALQSKIRIGQDMNTLHAELVSWAVTIYMQPLIDGAAFNDERLEEVRSKILQLPLTQVYPVGSFFLNGWVKFLKLSGSTYTPPLSPMRKSGPELPLFSLNFMNLMWLSSSLVMILQNLTA